ncbi:hypothetical protein Tco_0808788, partial [Tanacetum coccineum]
LPSKLFENDKPVVCLSKGKASQSLLQAAVNTAMLLQNRVIVQKASDKTSPLERIQNLSTITSMLPIYGTSDLPFSQDPKSSHDDGSKPSSDDGKKVDEDPTKRYIELPDDPNMSALEYYSILDFTRDGEDDGVVADMNNLDTTI